MADPQRKTPQSAPAAPLPLMGYWRMRTGDGLPNWSRELYQIFGLAPEGPPPGPDALPSLFENAQEFEALRRRSYKGETGPTRDLWVRQPNGARRLVRISAGLERDPQGAITGTYGLVVDVTDFNEAMQAAHNNEQLLSTFIDHAPAALAMFDTEMRYMRVSARWRADYGLANEEIIGRTHYDVFPEIPEHWKQIHQRCLAGAVERCERDPFDRVDGSRQWLSWEVRPWRKATGEIGGILMLTRDITDLVASMEALEQTDRRLELALRVSDTLVWQRDRRSMRVVMNGAIEKLLGVASESMSWEEIWEIVHAEDRPAMMDAFAQAVLTRRPFRFEHRLRPVAGRQLWALSVIEPLFDENGEHVGAIGLLKDITEQRTEKEALRAAQRSAESASRAKSDFLATMSHEIRTPMNGVFGAAQALARTELNAHQRALVDLMLSSGQSLRELVDDALDIGRIEGNQLKLRQVVFDLHEEIRQAIALFEPAAIAKQITLVHDVTRLEGRKVRGDPVRLRQIITNLVGNAVKFTDAGRVIVAADALRDASDRLHCVLMVRDTGPGVPEADRERIFERFTQLDAGDALGKGGAGLGLSVARGLARAFGGDIRCESRASGAEFILDVRLPLASAEIERNEQPHAVRENRLNILIAEDNPLNQQIVRLLLEPYGWDLKFASDGSQAHSMLYGERFDLVLMDLQTPRMGGLEAIRAIRTREAATGAPPTPILCLTAQAAPTHVRDALAAGADGLVAKPILIEELATAISKALANSADLAA